VSVGYRRHNIELGGDQPVQGFRYQGVIVS
jgi:hypothetical protein